LLVQLRPQLPEQLRVQLRTHLRVQFLTIHESSLS